MPSSRSSFYTLYTGVLSCFRTGFAIFRSIFASSCLRPPSGSTGRLTRLAPPFPTTLLLRLIPPPFLLLWLIPPSFHLRCAVGPLLSSCVSNWVDVCSSTPPPLSSGLISIEITSRLVLVPTGRILIDFVPRRSTPVHLPTMLCRPSHPSF